MGVIRHGDWPIGATEKSVSHVIESGAIAQSDVTGLVAALVKTVRAAAGVPSGVPTGTELPIAFDSTASTGGLYVWTGAAWVKAATIP